MAEGRAGRISGSDSVRREVFSGFLGLALVEKILQRIARSLEPVGEGWLASIRPCPFACQVCK